jgi:hypothetical protein
MFKRLRWLTTGFALGVATSCLAALRVRRTLRSYAPPQVVDRLGANASNMRRDVNAAVGAGRDAMRLREAELRAEIGRRWQ